jgi:hypothetical protein
MVRNHYYEILQEIIVIFYDNMLQDRGTVTKVNVMTCCALWCFA